MIKLTNVNIVYYSMPPSNTRRIGGGRGKTGAEKEGRIIEKGAWASKWRRYRVNRWGGGRDRIGGKGPGAS